MTKETQTSVVLMFLAGFQSLQLIHAYQPPNGYVPNEETAIAIAVAVWNPIYGKDLIAKEKPYSAKLADGVWVVSGSLKRFMGLHGTTKGGCAIAHIKQENGEILNISHSK